MCSAWHSPAFFSFLTLSLGISSWKMSYLIISALESNNSSIQVIAAQNSQIFWLFFQSLITRLVQHGHPKRSGLFPAKHYSKQFACCHWGLLMPLTQSFSENFVLKIPYLWPVWTLGCTHVGGLSQQTPNAVSHEGCLLKDPNPFPCQPGSSGWRHYFTFDLGWNNKGSSPRHSPKRLASKCKGGGSDKDAQSMPHIPWRQGEVSVPRISTPSSVLGPLPFHASPDPTASTSDPSTRVTSCHGGGREGGHGAGWPRLYGLRSLLSLQPRGHSWDSSWPSCLRPSSFRQDLHFSDTLNLAWCCFSH